MKLSLLVDLLEKVSSKVLFTPLRQSINFLTKVKIANLIKNTDNIKIEIGAGRKKGSNGWLTMDLDGGADIQWDLRYGMPFSDNSIDQIYSSHFFEHLTASETSKLLKECKRVLKPGGIFSICVPNAKRYIEAYLNKDISFWQQQEDFYAPAYNDTTIIDYINYVAYMDGQHKYMFDQENLLHILNSHNFKAVRLVDFRPALDMKERDFESIYADAVK